MATQEKGKIDEVEIAKIISEILVAKFESVSFPEAKKSLPRIFEMVKENIITNLGYVGEEGLLGRSKVADFCHDAPAACFECPIKGIVCSGK